MGTSQKKYEMIHQRDAALGKYQTYHTFYWGNIESYHVRLVSLVIWLGKNLGLTHAGLGRMNIGSRPSQGKIIVFRDIAQFHTFVAKNIAGKLVS